MRVNTDGAITSDVAPAGTAGKEGAVMGASLLDTIYATRQVTCRDGSQLPLNSEITRDEGQLMASLIRERGFTRTLEVGCAYGISSLFICGALAGVPGARHTMLDPGQSTYWKGIGTYHLEQAGYSAFTELLEEPSELALPRMVEQKRSFQFALIDGFHTFDHVLLDFFYVNRLLEVGGVVVLDDLQLPAIRRVARYLSNYPNYKVVRSAKRSVFPPSWRRRLVEGPLRLLARLLPATAREQIFDPVFFRSDLSRGLVSEMVAFEKTGADERGSHWYEPF